MPLPFLVACGLMLCVGLCLFVIGLYHANEPGLGLLSALMALCGALVGATAAIALIEAAASPWPL